MSEFFVILFALLVLHALADFPFQGEHIALGKNRSAPLPNAPWWYLLGVHSLMHAGAVFFVTFNWYFAAAEFIIHAVTDDAKCRGRIGYLTDQGIHIGCKVVWAGWAAWAMT